MQRATHTLCGHPRTDPARRKGAFRGAAQVVSPASISQEFYSFLTTTTQTSLVVDRSPANELLKVNFNIR